MAEVVDATVQKWGNGLAIRLTQRVAKASGVQEGTDVVIRADNGVLIVETKKRCTSSRRSAAWTRSDRAIAA